LFKLQIIWYLSKKESIHQDIIIFYPTAIPETIHLFRFYECKFPIISNVNNRDNFASPPHDSSRTSLVSGSLIPLGGDRCSEVEGEGGYEILTTIIRV